MNTIEARIAEFYEAAEYQGAHPAQVDVAAADLFRAIQVDQRAHEREDHQPMSLTAWVDGHSAQLVQGLVMSSCLRAHAPQLEGLLRQFIDIVEPLCTTRARPVQGLSDITRPAYRLEFHGPIRLAGFVSEVRSNRFIGAVLGDLFVRDRGMACIRPGAETLTFAYDLTPGIFTATPAEDPGLPLCADCNQWEREHTPADRVIACTTFTP